jgi:ATP-dependent Clp protease, protease subunit
LRRWRNAPGRSRLARGDRIEFLGHRTSTKEKHVSDTPRNAATSTPLGLDDNVYQRLLKERIIWLGDEVRDDNANAICAKMLLLAAEDPDEDIYLYINSPGGSITAGMAIYDTMQFIKPDVTTVAMGLAASMGQFLLTAGAPGKRYATPHTRVLMHQPLGGLQGSATDIRIQADLILSMKKQMAEITAARSGQTVERITRDSDRDHWFTAAEAKEYGLIDKVVVGSKDVSGGGGAEGHDSHDSDD